MAWLTEKAASFSLPPGRRVHAIGNIHGRLDLFAALLDKLRSDDHARTPMQVDVVLLGDLIDRGDDSAGVVRLAMQPLPWANIVELRGNHEDAMLAALGSDCEMMKI